MKNQVTSQMEKMKIDFRVIGVSHTHTLDEVKLNFPLWNCDVLQEGTHNQILIFKDIKTAPFMQASFEREEKLCRIVFFFNHFLRLVSV